MEEEVVKEVEVEVENPISDNLKHPTKKKKNLELARSSSTASGEQVMESRRQ